MAAPLRSKLLKKSTFFQANDNYRVRYEKLRKWLCTDSKMIRSVLDAEKGILKWYKTEKTLLLNCEKFLEKVDHYIYTIRFAVTHGVNRARFDILSEQRLFKLFVQKVGQDRIRQEAEKYCQTRNLAVLKIICKQVDTELTIPAEYKLRTTPKELNCIDGREADQVEPGDEEEINYIYNQRRGGYRGNYRGNGRRFPQPSGGYGNYRQYKIPQYNNNYYRGGRRSRNSRRYGPRGGYRSGIQKTQYKSKICTYCVKYGHLESDCYAKLAAQKLQKMKEAKLPETDIRQYVQERSDMYLIDDSEEYPGGSPDYDVGSAAEEPLISIEETNDIKEAPTDTSHAADEHENYNIESHHNNDKDSGNDTFRYTYPRNQ